MPPTGTFDSWPADPMDLGPLYPLVGSELAMTVICFLVFAGFFIWKIKLEKHKYEKETAALNGGND